MTRATSVIGRRSPTSDIHSMLPSFTFASLDAIGPQSVHHRVETVLERGQMTGGEVGRDELARRAVVGLVTGREHVDRGAERGHVELRRLPVGPGDRAPR